jgi:hypothetical protein
LSDINLTFPVWATPVLIAILSIRQGRPRARRALGLAFAAQSAQDRRRDKPENAMKRLLLVSVLVAAPLCRAHADEQAEFAALVERYASSIFLSSQAVACHLRDADWAAATNKWFYAAGIIGESELFPDSDGTKQTAAMEARFDRASKQGSAAGNPAGCAKLRASGQLEQIDKQVNEAK